MFTNVGWTEIFAIIVVGLIVVGPERLPRVVEDVRAALIAARRAINQVKAEMQEDMGTDFGDITKPINELAKLKAMGPRAALTKTLFDGDDTFLESFDPKKIMASGMTAGQAQRHRAAEQHMTKNEAATETTRVTGPDPFLAAASQTDDISRRIHEAVEENTGQPVGEQHIHPQYQGEPVDQKPPAEGDVAGGSVDTSTGGFDWSDVT